MAFGGFSREGRIYSPGMGAVFPFLLKICVNYVAYPRREACVFMLSRRFLTRINFLFAEFLAGPFNPPANSSTVLPEHKLVSSFFFTFYYPVCVF